jgi:hypothetical protein
MISPCFFINITDGVNNLNISRITDGAQPFLESRTKDNTGLPYMVNCILYFFAVIEGKNDAAPAMKGADYAKFQAV